MAFVSGFGGHLTSQYKERRKSLSVPENVENCGCIKISLKQRQKKKDKARLLKERIRQFSIWFFEDADQKEVEHARRRVERRKKKKHMFRGYKRCLMCLYGFDIILWLLGTVFTICSSIKAVGEESWFYKSRHLYRLLGPGFLLAAMLILFVATGLKHRITRDSKPQRSFYIVQKKKKASSSSLHKKDPNDDSGNEEDIEMGNINKQTFSEMETEEEKEGLAIAKSILKSDTDWSEQFTLECTKLVEQPDVEGVENTSKRAKDRRRWTKTKWMRVETESDEDDDLGDISDIRLAGNMEAEENIRPIAGTEIGDVPKFGKRRITRFKPIPGSCFTAQSSIKSHASEMSYTSTTSESAPLFKR